MKPLIVLLSVFVMVLFVIKLRTKKTHWKLAGRIAMSTMLLFTAIAHFLFAEGMTQMVPNFFPFKKGLVYLTGVMEVLFAIGFLISRIKVITGLVLIVFFILVLPSNVKAAIENINYQTGALDGYGIEYLWFRIPLQILFISWVYFTSIHKAFENKACT